MNATKERWQTPRTAFERFVTDRYVAACADEGHYELLPGAIAEPSAQFVLDWNRNGIYDQNPDGQHQVNTSGTQQTPADNAISYWGWRIYGDQVDEMTRYRLFQVQNEKQYKAYGEQWVSNRNHS